VKLYIEAVAQYDSRIESKSSSLRLVLKLVVGGPDSTGLSECMIDMKRKRFCPINIRSHTTLKGRGWL
jgi:hypothetical protein